jgi:hypothetical protein
MLGFHAGRLLPEYAGQEDEFYFPISALLARHNVWVERYPVIRVDTAIAWRQMLRFHFGRLLREYAEQEV